jgi:hypothetical protein
MSADRWSKCPKCNDAKTAEIDAFEAKVDEAYGLVSAADYKKLSNHLAEMRIEAANKARTDREHTFREDWEISGIEEGEIKVSYSGGCNVCSLVVGFEYRYPFYPPKPVRMSTDFPGTAFGRGDTITVIGPDDGSERKG